MELKLEKAALFVLHLYSSAPFIHNCKARRKFGTFFFYSSPQLGMFFLVVYLLSRTARFVPLQKIRSDRSRNLSSVSIHSSTVLLQQCPIEHNLSIIAFSHSPPAPGFLLPSVTRGSAEMLAATHSVDSHRAPEQTSGHIYHLTVCQDDYWIKITI